MSQADPTPLNRPLCVDDFGGAAMLAFGRTKFREIVKEHGIRVVRFGRRTVYPVAELEKVIERQLEASGRIS